MGQSRQPMSLLAAFETPSTMNEAVELINVRQGQLTAEQVAHRLTKAELRRLQHQLVALQAEQLSMIAKHTAEKNALKEMLSASEARANQLETEARAHAREMAKLNSKLANLEEDMANARADMDKMAGAQTSKDPRLDMLQRELAEQAALLKSRYQQQIDDLTRRLREALAAKEGEGEAEAKHAHELADMEARCAAMTAELQNQLDQLLAAHNSDKAMWQETLSQLQARVAELEALLAAEQQKVADAAEAMEALKKAHELELAEVKEALAQETARREGLEQACKGLLLPTKESRVGQSFLSQAVFVARKSKP